MALDVVVGSQWGDEGKGRITDLLAAEADIVARFSGGDNAGHSVTVGDRLYKLHLVPSGIVHSHTTCMLGSGMVVNPVRLLEEMDYLDAHGVDISPKRLKISSAAHIITPSHIALDKAREAQRGKGGIGTTQRGIGPAYTDKATRSGIRAGSMENPEEFADLVEGQARAAANVLEKVFHYQQAPNPTEVARSYCDFAKRLRPYLTDVGALIAEALDQGKNVLAEGAQGTLLDLDHGTYPFVTSSYPTTAGALMGLGVGPKHLRRIIGVAKSFQTRVGSGAFPTECEGDIAQHLRGTGDQPWDEYGTTTGRPRRCGWLDAVLLRYAVRINSFTELALTKLDILTGLDPVQICTAYQYDGTSYSDLPADPTHLAEFTPQYEASPGWDADITQARHWNDLPEEAQAYVRRVQELANTPIRLISIGPEREQVIRNNNAA
ncbi:MAG: adenylosuccinate synthase [Anaerolineales bacterium]|jgi:adenylosuccinate synthase